MNFVGIKLKIAITYSRCSTKKQDLESQNAKLNNWASTFDKHIHFEDIAISGRKYDREGITKLMEYVRANYNLGNEYKIGVVELSRIGRSIGFICNTIKELSDLKVPIVLVNTNTCIDYNTLEGSAMVNALAMAADIEWRLIHDRNQRGRDKIKSENIKVGRKTLTEKKGLSMVAINALKEKGMSLREIAKELNCSAPTIMRYLRNKDGHI